MGAPRINYGVSLSTRIRRTFDRVDRSDKVFAMVAAIIVGFTAWYTIFYSPDPPEYWQGHFETILNPLDRTEQMQLIINLRSTTFAAQDTVTAYVTLVADGTRPHISGNNIPEEFYRLAFEKTYCYVDPYPYMAMELCSTKLNKRSWSTDILENGTGAYFYLQYTGAINLTYSYGGDFDVYLSKEVITENVTSQATQVGKKFIHVESVEAKNSFDQSRNAFLTQKYALAAAVAAGIIAGLNLHYRKKERKYSSSSAPG